MRLQGIARDCDKKRVGLMCDDFRMLAGLSESLTLTLVLLLVFGSACLYLYTKISQAEQKISLIESILLDLKMASDLRNMGGSDAYGDDKDADADQNMSAANAGTGADVYGSGHGHSTYSMDDVEYGGDFGVGSKTSEVKIDEDFSEVLQSAHAHSQAQGASDSIPVADFEEELDSKTSPASAKSVEPDVALATADLSTEATTAIGVSQIDSNDIPFESLDSTSGGSQQPNLESMTAKELHGLAKQRGLAGESKMTRAQLIESLRTLPSA